MNSYFGIHNYVFVRDEANSIINQTLHDGITGYVCFVDGTSFSIAKHFEQHQNILNSALFCNCDSSWIPLLINNIYNTNYKHYTGSDFFLEYVQKQYTQCFIGTNPEILKGLQNEIKLMGVDICDINFVNIPYCNVEDFDYHYIASLINDIGPCIIWISLGCPKQEEFMYRLLPMLNKGIMFGVGAVFNFYSGLNNVPKRAPQWMIRCHLEFVYRLFSEPKKQMKRCWLIVKTLPKIYFEEKKRCREVKV